MSNYADRLTAIAILRVHASHFYVWPPFPAEPTGWMAQCECNGWRAEPSFYIETVKTAWAEHVLDATRLQFPVT